MKFHSSLNMLYIIVRNYYLTKTFRKFFKRYNDYKHNTDIYNTNYLSSIDKNDIVPYVNATVALNALKFRGGAYDAPFYYALFRLMNLVEKYIFKSLPKRIVAPFIAWKKLKKAHPEIEVLEDILVVYFSVTSVGVVLYSKNNPTIDLGDTLTERISTFEQFLLKEGVNNEICDSQATMLYNILGNSSIDSDVRLTLLRLWFGQYSTSSNAGEQQGLILCFIAALKFLFFADYNEFTNILNLLRNLLKEGKISEAMFKLILRRLERMGVSLK